MRGSSRAFVAPYQSGNFVVYARVYRVKSGTGFEAEAEAVFDEDHSMVIWGGGVKETFEEAQKVAEIIGNWLALQHHPLDKSFSRCQVIWNRKLVQRAMSPKDLS